MYFCAVADSVKSLRGEDHKRLGRGLSKFFSLASIKQKILN